MPRMTRKQALERLQAVCDRKGWEMRDMVYCTAQKRYLLSVARPTVTEYHAPILTDLVAAMELAADHPAIKEAA